MTAEQLERPYTRSSADYVLALRDKSLHDTPVVLVQLDELHVVSTPRTGGLDSDYIGTLAEVESELPPILVHRPTMRVIDGVHRFRAAQANGRTCIMVRYFDGDAGDADLLAVALNVSHGRPLSTEDRVSAAERIFTTHPQWSDRAVAAVAGLSARKVSEIRQNMVGALLHSDRRIGLDGRSRPVDSTHGRELAGRLIKENPTASLRAIARQAGISPATVADVRSRVMRGDDPVPARRGRHAAAQRTAYQPADRSSAQRSDSTRSLAELGAVFDTLRRDPSMRLNEMGRHMLRMLDAAGLVAQDRQRFVECVPTHCKLQMSELVHGYAQIWEQFARDLKDQLAAECD
jgi:ParB-like chromosome segregation protein Spo0J